MRRPSTRCTLMEDIVDDLPEDPNPFDTLRPVLMEMCDAVKYRKHEFPCPLSLGGLCAIDRLLGSKVYRPVARCFEWPEFPRDTQRRCCSGKASCSKRFRSLAALRAHARSVGVMGVPDDWQEQGYR